MTLEKDSAAELVDRLKRKGPALLDLLVANTIEEFEAAFTTILETAIVHLERNKKNFVSLKEEGLTAVIAGSLTMPGLRVTQETNSNGHVDLTIEADHCTPARVKLGEAKIYLGPSYHMKGVKQLLGRYTTGREMPGLLISYVRIPNIKGLTEKLRFEMNQKLPESQMAPCKDHSLKWSLVTEHSHSSGEVVQLDHIGCNLSI